MGARDFTICIHLTLNWIQLIVSAP
jgi:hypothetical protein